MRFLRLIGNILRLLAFFVQWLLYWPAHILGGKGALPVYFVGSVAVAAASQDGSALYFLMAPWLVFRAISKIARRPNPLVLFRAPPKPPPPPPRASTAQGRADDPSEATVIGRLDPKLRELLRQKPDAAG